MEKDIFYEKMQSYFDEKIVREVYSSNHICILSVGEACYVACSYALLNDEPLGIFINSNQLEEISEDNTIAFSLYGRKNKFKK